MQQQASLEERTDGALHRLYEMTSKREFDDLLQYASSVCLSEVPTYETGGIGGVAKPENTEERIVVTLGLRGLRAAVELAEGYTHAGNRRETEPASENEETEDEPERIVINLESPTRYPFTWSNSLDTDTLRNVETFGEQLLDETYKVLGEDVEKYVTLLKNASDAQEQMKIIKWLDKRIAAMTKHEDVPEEGEPREHFYHPVRLSPKIMGVYPEHKLRPTCLGISVISASFFKQAGVNMVHAGVNESGDEHTLGLAIELTDEIVRSLEDRYGLTVGNAHKHAIATLGDKMMKAERRPDAQHAVTYAQLLDGSWAQFDPNYHATEHITNPDDTAKLTKSYDLLSEMKGIAPGLEVSTHFSWMMSITDFLHYLAKKQSKESVDAVREEARKALLEVGDESVLQELYEKCMAPFFQPADESNEADLLSQFQQVIADYSVRIQSNGQELPVIEDSFYETFRKYVLWGDSLESFLQRVKSDEQYLENRVEDIAILPFMMMLSAAKHHAEEFTPWYPHAKLDIGLPASRIGMAVLSDFAVYDETPIADSFWLSHWPGNAAVTEHMHQEPPTKIEQTILFANLIYYAQHPFTSQKNYDMVEASLDKLGKDEDGKPL